MRGSDYNGDDDKISVLTMTMTGKNTNFLNLRFSADFSKRPEDFLRISIFNDAFPKTFRHFPKFSIDIPNTAFRKTPKKTFFKLATHFGSFPNMFFKQTKFPDDNANLGFICTCAINKFLQGIKEI